MTRTRSLRPSDKFVIAYRDGFRCRYCGSQPGFDELEIEHCIPVSKHGSDNPENLVAACIKCNRGKGTSIAFPENECSCKTDKDEGWTILKSFGEWNITFHPVDGVVLEYAPTGYFISRFHGPYTEKHILQKRWREPHTPEDFLAALYYCRRLTCDR